MNAGTRLSNAGYSMGGSLANQAQANQAQCTEPQVQTGIRSTVNRLQHNGSRLSKSIIDLRDIIDRLIGSTPMDAKIGTAPQAVPNGDIQAVHAEIDAYENMLTMFEAEINRLRTL